MRRLARCFTPWAIDTDRAVRDSGFSRRPAESTAATSVCGGGCQVKALLDRLWHDDNGQDIAEYALMLTVILLIVAATVTSIGTNADAIFSNVANKLVSS